MIDYATVPNTTGSYPDVLAVNASGPGATDGTPYLKKVIEDLWGHNQALMNAAGLTPSGTTESDAAGSQRLVAMQNVCGGPGEVIAWMGDAADPSTLDKRLLPLNGQGILRANYPDLDTVCYVGDSDNPTASAFYRATDAGGTSRSTTGAYLILPDLRGYVLRGLDTAAAVDPDGASRDIGHAQDWAIVEHDHYVWNGADKVCVESGITESGTNNSFYRLNLGSESSTDAFAETIPTYSIPATNQRAENRMVNIATRWAIRY